MGDIKISEGYKENISTGGGTATDGGTRYYFKIKLPTGYEFDNTITPGLEYNGDAIWNSQTLSGKMYSSSDTKVDQFEFKDPPGKNNYADCKSKWCDIQVGDG